MPPLILLAIYGLSTPKTANGTPYARRSWAKEILTDIESGKTDQRIHFVTYWEPSAVFDVFAPRGIRLWAQVLRDRHYQGKKEYTYFGKISKSVDDITKQPILGVRLGEIRKLNRRIKDQNKTDGETYLYMWTAGHSDKGFENSLHVGKVTEISVYQEKFLDSDFPVPVHFYRNIERQYPYRETKDLFPVWFKLEDIRQLDFDRHKNLMVRLPDQEEFRQFDPNNRDHRLSPLMAKEKVRDPISWFCSEDLAEREWKGWWEEVLLGFGDWDTGQFHNDDLKRVYAEALRFSRFNVPILILGQRGVGKTFLARWIRSQSPFQNAEFAADPKTWPQVACGSFLNQDLLWSELFGHQKGAFTDAVGVRKGLVSTLDGDTLFLDEIGDLPRPIQRALIKAIEEKRYKPLGADKATHESNFRLIAATNKPWSKLKQDLDPDFLDRINDVVLRLPPLKEMRDDIPWLWRGVYWKLRKALEPDLARIRKEREDLKLPPSTRKLSKTDEDLLVEFLQKEPLSGNLRDLRAVALHVIVTLRDPTAPSFDPEKIIRKALSQRVGAPNANSEAPDESDVSRRVALAFALRQSLDDVVRNGRRLDYDQLAQELKGYVAGEVLRICKERSSDFKTLCDKPSKRTLKDWRREIRSYARSAGTRREFSGF